MTIYLEPNEEITSVVDHLISSKEIEIVFVIPIGAQILQSLINLRLLKREADNLNKKLIIVTQDEMGQKLARKAGLELSISPHAVLTPRCDTPLIKTEDIQERYEAILSDAPITKSRGRSKLKEIFDGEVEIKKVDYIAPPDNNNSPMVLDIKEEKHLHAETKKTTPDFKLPQIKFPSFKILTAICGAIIGIGSLGFLFSALPKAEITLQPKLESVNAGLAIKIDSNIASADYSKNIIAGQLIKLEKTASREFSATGERQLNEKASGKIIIYNAYSSASQTLVATTRFLSESGKIFRITKTILVPGAEIEEGKIIPSSMEVEVIADEPGDSFNIPPANFTIPGFDGTPKYKAFYAKSTEAMKGGAVGKAKVVSSEDIEKAKEIMTKAIREAVYAQIKEDTPAGYKLFDFAMTEKSLTFFVSPEAGNQAEKFTLNLKMVLEGILFAEEDAQKLVIARINNQLPDGQEFIDKSLHINYKLIDIDFNAGTVDLSISFDGRARKQLDLELIKRQIAGKNQKQIQEALDAVPGIASTKIKLWPFWVKTAPKDLSKIKIIIEN